MQTSLGQIDQIPQQNKELENQILESLKIANDNLFSENGYYQQKRRNLLDYVPFEIENINYYLPCNQQVADHLINKQIVESADLVADRTKFIISKEAECLALHAHANAASLQVTVHIFTFLGNEQICDLKEVNVDLGCSGQFGITFQTIEIDASVTDPSPIKIYEENGFATLFGLGYIKNILAENRAIIDGLTDFTIQNTQNQIKLVNLIFQNVEEHFIDLKMIQVFVMYNTKIFNFLNQESAAVQTLQVLGIIIDNCLFQDNENMFDNGGGIEILISAQVTVTNTQFIHNKARQYGAGIYISQCYNLEMDNVDIIDNKIYILNAGGFGIIIFENATIKNSTIQDNESFQDYGGVLFYGGLYVTITDTDFINNQSGFKCGAIGFLGITRDITLTGLTINDNKALSDQGGVIFTFDVKAIIITNCNFTNNQAGYQGGAISFMNIKFVTIEGSTFTENKSPTGYGGAIRYSGEMLLETFATIKINSCTFNNNVSKFGGGISLFYIRECGDCHFTDLTFNENQGYSAGGGLMVEQVEATTYFQDLVFNNQFAKDIAACMGLYQVKTSFLKNIQMYDNETNGKGAGIYLQDNCENINFDDIIVTRSKIGDQGSLFIKDSQSITMNQILIYDNVSEKSAAGLVIAGCDVVNIEKLFIKKNHAYQSAGFSIEFTNNITINDGELYENQSDDNIAGGMFLTSDTINITNFKIFKNKSLLNTGGIHFSQSKNSVLDYIELTQNESFNIGGGISIDNCEIFTLKNSKILGNISKRDGGGIKIQQSKDVTFQNLVINNNISKEKNGGGIYADNTENIIFNVIQLNNNQALNSAAIHFQQINTFDLNNLDISYNIATNQVGAFNIYESENGLIQNSQLYKNKSFKFAAALSIELTVNLELQNVKVYDNIIEQSNGGGICILNSSQDIKINNSQIFKNQGYNQGGGIYINNIKNAKIYNVQIYENYASESGSGIYAFDSNEILIENSNISLHGQNDSQCQKGSAIFAEQIQNMTIQNTDIDENVSTEQGGSCYFTLIENLLIKNSVFDLNQILNNDKDIIYNYGGAIYINQASNFIFEENIINNSFSYNRGGGIYILSANDIKILNSKFFNNTVHFNPSISQYEKDQYYETTFGGSIYIEPSDYDIQDSKLLRNLEESLQKQLEITGNIFDSSQASSGGSILINLNPDVQQQLTINQNIFSNNIADIGSAIRILTKQNFSLYSQTLKNNTNQIIQEEDIFQGYIANERTQSPNHSMFVLCFQGSYLKEGGELICQQCIDNAKCDGGYIPLYPSQGYWRSEKDPYEMIHCFNNPKYCLGNDTCLEGYTGLLCEQCDYMNRYAQSGVGECSKCAENDFIIYQRLVLIFFGVVLLLLNQIYGVNMRIKKRQIQHILNVLFDYSVSRISQLSGITKIFIMHCQITYLVASFNLEIPIEVTSSMSVLGDPQQLFSDSINCIMKVESVDDVKQLGYLLSVYSLVATVLTVIFIIIIEIFIYFCKKIITAKRQLFQYIQCSILCFYITLQPGLLQQYLSFVSCREIGGEKYSVADTNISCKEDFYYHKILPINITMIFIIGFAIPLFLGFRLLKGKTNKRLNRVDFQRKYGILYMEYKQEHFYWEIYSILTKICIVILSILFVQDVIMKSVFVSFILVVYSFMCLIKKPFNTLQLNKLSLSASFIQILTLGLVMCINEIEEGEQEIFKLVLSIIIYFINSVFLLLSGVLMALDFKMTFRNFFTSKFKSGCMAIRGKLTNKITQERQAKERWRKIKLSIHEIILRQRSGEVKNFSQELLDHMKQIFAIKQDFVPARITINRQISKKLSLYSQQSPSKKSQGSRFQSPSKKGHEQNEFQFNSAVKGIKIQQFEQDELYKNKFSVINEQANDETGIQYFSNNNSVNQSKRQLVKQDGTSLSDIQLCDTIKQSQFKQKSMQLKSINNSKQTSFQKYNNGKDSQPIRIDEISVASNNNTIHNEQHVGDNNSEIQFSEPNWDKIYSDKNQQQYQQQQLQIQQQQINSSLNYRNHKNSISTTKNSIHKKYNVNLQSSFNLKDSNQNLDQSTEAFNSFNTVQPKNVNKRKKSQFQGSQNNNNKK